MKRRTFITLLGGAVVAWPLAARAQESARSVRIGLLVASPLPPVERFLRKLQQYGYVEGRNLRLESRFAEGRPLSRARGGTRCAAGRHHRHLGHSSDHRRTAGHLDHSHRHGRDR
jgi:hypothetical protein